MKKIFLFLTTILTLMLVGCSNETDFDASQNSVPTAKSNQTHWYGTGLSDVQTRGASDGDKLWNANNSGITIKFLNQPSDQAILSKVKSIAKEWEEYAGIQLNFVESDKTAAVRIAFDWKGNDWLTWSYTGNDAKYVRNQTQPTAVFGGLDLDDEETFRGDVLRVFGQILGLEYEQRHQDWAKNGYWKTESALEKYWMDQFDGIDMDWSEIREYVFVPLTEANAGALMQTKEIDEASIMAWPYYNTRQTTNRIANFELSEGDKIFIATLYPKDEQQLPTIQEAWVDSGYFEWANEDKNLLYITTLGIEQEYLPDVSDGEQLTSANTMFFCSFGSIAGLANNKLKKAPKFNTSNITDFENMFFACRQLTSIPNLDTSKGINFRQMFGSCTSLTSIPDLDTSKGTNFSEIFASCTSLTTIPKLDTSNGDRLSTMFKNCTSLTTIPDLNTSNVSSFMSMFEGCTSLITIPELDTSKGRTFSSMFKNCTSLTTIPDLNTSNVINFMSMFENCTSLIKKPILDLSKPGYKDNMYKGTIFENDPL